MFGKSKNSKQKTTFPKAKRFNHGFIPLTDEASGHEIYYEEYGKRKGDPVIFLHGGPGGGASIGDTEYFDPRHYRIIIFDQRGAGNSKPAQSLENNTTAHLIEDINRLRFHLKIKKKAHIFGGSWGSTLSLAYAITHPDLVKSLTLRGIFLARKRDIDVFYQGNAGDPTQQQTALAATFFPAAWAQYVEFIPVEERSDMLSAYQRRLNGGDRGTQLEAARRWSIWEGSASKLVSDSEFLKTFSGEAFALAFARIETHYFANRGFLGVSGGEDQDYIRENIGVIAKAGIPTEIVHGQYDLVCPRYQADELIAAWADHGDPPPLHIVTAGHSAKEPEIHRTLIEITERMKTFR